jgi:hypothetical protein
MNTRALVIVASLVLLSTCDQNIGNTAAAEVAENRDVAGVLRKLVADPQFAWLARMSRLYPAEYRTVERAMQAQADGGADLLATKRALAEALKPVMLGHCVLSGAPLTITSSSTCAGIPA